MACAAFYELAKWLIAVEFDRRQQELASRREHQLQMIAERCRRKEQDPASVPESEEELAQLLERAIDLQKHVKDDIVFAKDLRPRMLAAGRALINEQFYRCFWEFRRDLDRKKALTTLHAAMQEAGLPCGRRLSNRLLGYFRYCPKSFGYGIRFKDDLLYILTEFYGDQLPEARIWDTIRENCLEKNQKI